MGVRGGQLGSKGAERCDGTCPGREKAGRFERARKMASRVSIGSHLCLRVRISRATENTRLSGTTGAAASRPSVAITNARLSVIAEYSCSVVGACRSRMSCRSARLRRRSAALICSSDARRFILPMPEPTPDLGKPQHRSANIFSYLPTDASLRSCTRLGRDPVTKRGAKPDRRSERRPKVGCGYLKRCEALSRIYPPHRTGRGEAEHSSRAHARSIHILRV